MDFAPIPADIFTSVCMDFLELPPVKVDEHIFDYAFVQVCRLSGFVSAFACAKTGLNSEKFASLYLNKIVSFTGIPFEIVSDNDHLITSRFFTTICQLAGIHQYQSILYRPRGNGRAERAVQSIVDILRRTLTNTELSWVHALPWCVFTLNTLPGILRHYCPYELVFGRAKAMIGDHLTLYSTNSSSSSAFEWFDNLARIRATAQQQLSEIHDRIQRKFLKNAKQIEYKEGDKIWLRHNVNTADKMDKIHPLYSGPYEILKRRAGTGRYKIAIPHGSEDVHQDRMKPCYETIDGKEIPLRYF